MISYVITYTLQDGHQPHVEDGTIEILREL